MRKKRRYSTILLKNDFNPKAVAKLMGHAKEKVTLQEYFDKKSVVSEGIPEIEKYMSEVLPKSGGHAESDDAVKDIVIDTSEYI